MSLPDTTSNIHIIDNETAPQQIQNQKITKEKLRNIMEAASALTALNSEELSEQGNTSTPLSPEKAPNETPEDEDDEDDDEEGSSSKKKRFIPEHKKPDAALTFPEKVRLT
jgi:hypothetical protein